jgi:hypothetical protein
MMQIRALRLVNTDSETLGSEPKDGARSMFAYFPILFILQGGAPGIISPFLLR